MLALALPLFLHLSAPAHADWPERRLGGDLWEADRLVLGDIDGDGHLDAATAGSFVPLTVLQGGGGGFIDLRIVDASAPNYFDICVADLDNDGDGDLVAATTDLFLYEHIGGFNFAAPTMLSGDAIESLWCGDLDRDGDDDIVVAVYSADEMGWFEQTAPMTFTYHSWVLPDPVSYIQVADLDQDLDLDIVAAFNGSGGSDKYNAWLVNDGLMNFGAPIELADVNAAPFAVGDVGSDGDIDVVLYHSFRDNVMLVENQGYGVFSSFDVSAQGTATSPISMAVVDVDEDGVNDVFTVDDWTWFRSLGGGAMGAAVTLPHSDSFASFGKVADLDGDGDPEIVGVDDGLTVLDLEQGAIAQARFHVPRGRATSIGDLDGDGQPDILLNNMSYSTIDGPGWLRNNLGTGQGLTEGLAIPDGTNPVHSGDLDNDGDLDLVSSHAWFDNDGAGNFTGPLALPFTTGFWDIAAVADFDADGMSDVLIASNDELYFLRRNGPGTFDPEILLATAVDDIDQIEITDLEPDGDPDLLIVTDTGILYYENQGGTVGPQRLLSSSPGDFVAADFDDDGFVDLVRSAVGLDLYFHGGQGTATLLPPVDLFTGLSCDDLAVADFDVDGLPDLVCSSWDDADVVWLENVGGGVFGPPQTIATNLFEPVIGGVADLDLDTDPDVVIGTNTAGATTEALTLMYENPGIASDADGDGVTGASDCDDNDPLRFPGAPEGCDFIDNDCDGLLGPAELDADFDGLAECEGDCDDADPTVYPGAAELCGDGIDNDCDGGGLAQETDDDGDGLAECEGDCDDTSAAVFPGAVEVCGDGIDNDCDGTPVVLEFDLDGDGQAPCAGDCNDWNADQYTGAAEICDGLDTDCDGVTPLMEFDLDGDGQTGCEGDCDDGDPTAWLGAVELCDLADNNCDGVVDEGLDTDLDGLCDALDPCPFDALDDQDGDGICDSQDLCFGNDAAGDADSDGLCDDGVSDTCYGDDSSGDLDGDGDCANDVNGFVFDCDDTEPTVFPGAPELCDGLDNDCDGVLPAIESDADADGMPTCAGDCDDTDADRMPGLVEVCDGLDNDCDGVVPLDEVDADQDGVSECDGDCDPLDPAVHPNASEACDGLDNDCDGVVPADELDGDGDGLSTCDGDCNDAEASVRPGQNEVCDGLDNDCDGDVDPGCETETETPTTPGVDGDTDAETDSSGCGCGTGGGPPGGMLVWLGAALALMRRRPGTCCTSI